MKKKIKIGAFIVPSTILGFALLASAQVATTTATVTLPPTMQKTPAVTQTRPSAVASPKQNQKSSNLNSAKGQPVINIDASGNALVRGTLVFNNGTTMAVKAYGATFTVDTSKAAISGDVKDLASFGVGDFVGVSGTIADASVSSTIVADTVRDRAPAPKGSQAAANAAAGTQLGQLSVPQGLNASSIPLPPQRATSTNGMVRATSTVPMMPFPGATSTNAMKPGSVPSTVLKTCAPGQKYNSTTGQPCPTTN